MNERLSLARREHERAAIGSEVAPGGGREVGGTHAHGGRARQASRPLERQRHRLGHIADRAHVDTLPHACLILGIGVRGCAHLDDADDLLVLARMIEKAEVAQLHRLHVVAGHEIAHARPRLALLAARLLHLPGVLLRLRLEEPIGRPGPLRGRRRRSRLCLGFLGHGSQSPPSSRLRMHGSAHSDRERSGDQGVGQPENAAAGGAGRGTT